jgi:pullulanase
LFRLRTAADVEQRLRFYNTGPAQLPGFIAFSLSDEDASIDPRFSLVVVLVNASPESQSLTVSELVGRKLQLHPIQTDSADVAVRTAAFDRSNGTFKVPGRTAAVFVASRGH